MRLGPGTPLTRDILFVYEDGTRLHCNYFGTTERAERIPSIVQADRLARALGTSLAIIFSDGKGGI